MKEEYLKVYVKKTDFKKSKKIFFCFLLLGYSLVFGGSVLAQPTHYTMVNAHSHNDYEQSLPFYGAYARHFGSIEVDLWAKNETLYVAHERDQISTGRTFRNLYLNPLIHQLKINNGYAYENGESLQLLIDLKSSYTKVLPLLREVLRPYRNYFLPSHRSRAIRIVISGNMPPPDSLHYFDTIFTFDGSLGNNYPPEDFRRIKLVSANVQKLVSWTEDEPLSATEMQTLRQVIESVHHKNKLIRFWGTPNTIQTYAMLMNLGVDYIGTDSLAQLECFIKSRRRKWNGNTVNLSLQLNQIQVVGTHNSYKVAIDSTLMNIISRKSPELAKELDYAHLSLKKQLNEGTRNLELDVYYDPKGGRYTNPWGLQVLKGRGLPHKFFDSTGKMKKPGLKVFHIPRIDFRSHNLLFRDALKKLKLWSLHHPDHIPIFITLEAKHGHVNIKGVKRIVQPLPFTANALKSIDAELKKFLGKDQLITPSMIRRKGKTLKASIVENGWSSLNSLRGKFLFILDEQGIVRKQYIRIHPNLKGQMMFVDVSANSPQAAVMIINSPIKQQVHIRKMVKKGFIVRTRADAGTVEARRVDYSRWKAAKKSGAQIITTDYIIPSLTFSSPYRVGSQNVYRKNPVLK